LIESKVECNRRARSILTLDAFLFAQTK